MATIFLQDTCTVCMDDVETELLFACRTEACMYKLCHLCIRRAFEDHSGSDTNQCPMCKAPMARDILETLVGSGAVRAVENQLRPKMEFDMEEEMKRREQRKLDMNAHKDKAAALFNELSEKLNMKCPRCKAVFYDYDGCNALRCSNATCKAAFCAVCLVDCGHDAHGHALSHGDLFNRKLFEDARNKREATIVKIFLADVAKTESFEVQQMLRNKYQESSSTANCSNAGTQANTFLEKTKEQLKTAIQNDRLGLLREVSDREFARRGLQFEDISPRSIIPEEYKLEIRPDGENKFVVTLYEQNGVDIYGHQKWKQLELDFFDDKNNDECAEHNPVKTDKRRVDSLINIKQSLKSGIVALEGFKSLLQTRYVPPPTKGGRDTTLASDEISILLHPITRAGQVTSDRAIVVNRSRVIGINQNQRFLLLEKHTETADDDVLMFDALKHFVQAKQSRKVFEDTCIAVPAPATFEELNDQQKKVAHPLALMTGMEVAGPPGTGKTKTITELIRCLLDCTDATAIVLSERNGAIDAIAAKFVERCLELKHNGIHRIRDIVMWNNLIVYGSGGGMGSSARHFTVESKMRYHPELVELRRDVDAKKAAQMQLATQMRRAIGQKLLSLSGQFPSHAVANRVQEIEAGHEAGFQMPLEIISNLQTFLDQSADFLRLRDQKEDALETIVINYRAFTHGLIRLDDEQHPVREPIRQRVENLSSIRSCLAALAAHNDLFQESEAIALQRASMLAKETLKIAVQRLLDSMERGARVMMSTIGSSHKLPIFSQGDNNDDDDSDLERRVQEMKIGRDEKCVVIFDEAGCIPSYELLGLSRFGRNIDAIVAVGDKHQLPPYNPQQSFGQRKAKTSFRQRSLPTNVVADAKVESILDASRRKRDDSCKIMLTTQYRVPRDIAQVLDTRIYRGDYKTHTACKAPMKGFVLVHVPTSRPAPREREKYINRDEIVHCIDIVQQLTGEEERSIMVLTPYKKQQRELQLQFKRQGLKAEGDENAIAILTIDQCQGQEADYVLLSLVQRPTRFLDKHRMNVALSRVRKRLYMLTDKNEFRKASLDNNWECNLIAQDLLELS